MFRRFPALSALLIVFSSLVLLTADPACGATPKRAPQDRAEVEAFFDGVIGAQKQAHHINGVTIALIADGKVLFAKGYGYAEVAKNRPVDPERSMFRIASISKLFTWTAVMQLVEQRRLDLDRDVNAYLDFAIPPTYPEPITLSSLLTHTPGFEDHPVVGLFARQPEALLPLDETLRRDLPARVRPPRRLASYSNYGTALAGYIVQRVSGTPWEDYIEKNILQPLEMNHTTVRQPVPPALAADLSGGYTYSEGRFREQGFEYVPLRPAGPISASALDMTHFMIAHLQNGRYGKTRILAEQTAQRMHTRLFTHDPRLNGMLYGFIESNRNGERVFGHGGDTMWFHSVLLLLPERNAGLFVSYNTDSGAKARGELLNAFFDRYYPENRPAPKPAAPAALARFAGTYATTRYSHYTLAKLARAFGALQVSATEDGFLSTSGGSSETKRWAQIEPLLFRQIDGPDTMLFREEAAGQDIDYMFLNGAPIVAFQRLTGIQSPRFHLLLAGACALLFLSALIGWPVSLYLDWRRKTRRPAAARAAALVLTAAAALMVLFAAGMAVTVSNANVIVFGVPPALRTLLTIPPIFALLIAVAAAFTLKAWRRDYWSAGACVHYTLVVLAGFVSLWALNYWNLLGFRY